MPFTTVMDLKFNTEAKAEKWWSNFDSGQGSSIQNPELVIDGPDSYLRIVAAETVVPVAKAFKTKALMLADLAHPAGTLVNCFAIASADRGRYQKTGASGAGGWNRVGDIADKFWPDRNHKGRTLELPLCSNTDSTPLPPLVGNERGWVSPPGNNWTGVRVTIEMRVKNFHLGEWAKMVPHIQGNIAARTAVLPQVHPLGNFAVPNFILTDPISDALGFGDGGWGVANKVPYVEDSGWKQVTFVWSPDDEDADGLGRIDRDLAASPFAYISTRIAELLANVQGSSFFMIVHPTPATGDDPFAPTQIAIREADRAWGEILVRGIKVEAPT